MTDEDSCGFVATRGDILYRQRLTMTNTQIAEADVLSVGPEKLAYRLSLYADNATVWDSVMRVGGFNDSNIVSGKTHVTRFLTWLAHLPPVEVKILTSIAEGDHVAVDWLLRGGNGTFEIPCITFFEIKQGKIANAKMQFDSAFFAGLMQKK